MEGCTRLCGLDKGDATQMYVEPTAELHKKSNAAWIWRYCRPDAGRVWLSLSLFACSKAFTLVPPIIAGLIVNQVITRGLHAELIPYLLAMMGATLGNVATRYSYQIIMQRFGQNAIYRLVSDEYEKLHLLDFVFFDHAATGDLMDCLTADTSGIRFFLAWVSYNLLNCVVTFAAAIIALFSVDWRLALALACVTPFLAVIGRSLAKNSHSIYFGIRNSLARLNSMTEENIEANRVVKAFAREKHETGKFDRHNEDYYERNMKLAYNNAAYMPWLDGLSYSLTAITLVFGGWLAIKGYLSLGGLVTFQSFLWMIRMPTRMFGWLLNDVERFNASCIKIRRLLDSEPSIRSPRAGSTGKPPASGPVRGDIRFDHVSFAYPDAPDVPVLDDVSFHIHPGERVGILGGTGSGKSTLVALIARFYDPTAGRVYVDGIDVHDWDLTALRTGVTLAFQDTFLFSDTIADNIAFGANRRNKLTDRDDLRAMAVIADADGFISEMADGYDTIVGERGVGLSGGQRQRISLARALANHPAVLLLDDATSAVDMETEARIQKNLAGLDGGMTVFTIAYRVSSVRGADVIFVLDHGRIIEQGTHEQLLALHGEYWRTYRQQLGVELGRAANGLDAEPAPPSGKGKR